jgi:hypothetical protein
VGPEIVYTNLLQRRETSNVLQAMGNETSTRSHKAQTNNAIKARRSTPKTINEGRN